VFQLNLTPTVSYELTLTNTVEGVEGSVELKLPTSKLNSNVELQLSPFFVGEKGDKGDKGDTGEQGAQGPEGPSLIGGYPIALSSLGSGDLLAFSQNKWINTPQSSVTDGGNF
jgi:hypothetical protein